MKNKIIKTVVLCTLTIFSISCEDTIQESDSFKSLTLEAISEVKIVNGTAHISNKASLVHMMKEYQKNGEYQKIFDNQIAKFQSNGFKPLTPIFDKLNESQIVEFVERKKVRLSKRKIDFGFNDFQARVSGDQAITLDDDLIYDPAFASILNEDREIVVENDLYRYTEMGLFKVSVENAAILGAYLENLSVDQRRALIQPAPAPNAPCGGNNQVSILAIADNIELLQLPSLPPCQPTWSSTANSVQIPAVAATSQNIIKATLPICEGGESSLWDKLFGKTKTCTTFFPENRCLTNTFWNQNYMLFASLGCKASFEKKKCVTILWITSCWWEKSYPDQIELGVNSVKYEYVYNVPMFNSQAYQYATTFFSYNGTNWDSSGRVINTVPTGKGSFILDSENNTKGTFNIYILGHHITDANYNVAIDELAKLGIRLAPGWLGIDLKKKDDEDNIKYNVINSVPFDNKVTFLVSNLDWKSTDNKIVHYFDFNFLLSWNNNMTGFGDYLNGLNGASSYKNIEADIYGSASRGSVLSGNRLKYK